jgi:hypothetical protein
MNYIESTRGGVADWAVPQPFKTFHAYHYMSAWQQLAGPNSVAAPHADRHLNINPPCFNNNVAT